MISADLEENMEAVPNLLDLIEFKELTERAEATRGDPNAQFCLGLKHYQGNGCLRDFSKAAYWYGKAAEQGHAEAQEHLAEMLDHGKGVPRNLEETAVWYSKAAEQGRMKAQARLAAMLDRGEGISRDLEAAAALYCKAAKQGSEAAQLRLAAMLDKGEGVPRNREKAANLYRLLAGRGNPDARTWIDAFDAEEAKKLLEAARQGNANAQFALAEAYEEGRGVQRDMVLAWMWARLAADSGREDAVKLLEVLEKEMTDAEVMKAQRSARNRKPMHS